MKSILPMEYPIITVFPNHANSFSILSCQNQLGVLFNSFIQLVSWHNTNLDFFDFNYRYCSYFEYQRINKGNIVSITDFVIEAINQKNYVYLVVKRKYIPAYQNNHGTHDMLIYGYDSFKRLFYIADNFKGKYEFATCLFDELHLAVTDLTEEQELYGGFNKCLELIAYKNSDYLDNKPDLERIITSLDDYIKCKPTQFWYSPSIKWEERKSHSFGQNVYETIFRDLKNIKVNDFDYGVDIRNYQLVWDHKNILAKRLKYLFEYTSIKRNDHLYQQCESLAQESLILRNLILKYMVSKERSSIEKIYIGYEKLREKEIKTIGEYIDLLS